MLYLITGGSGSGKSEYAENIAARCHNISGERLIYLATMRVWDEEGEQRVKRHRHMRLAKGFDTIERYTDLKSLYVIPNEKKFRKNQEKPIILLECMSNLVLNEFYTQEEGTVLRILSGIKHLQNQCRDLIIVTNEIFSDGLAYDPESERYISLLGQINIELGRMADYVTEVVYGIPIIIRTPDNRNQQ